MASYQKSNSPFGKFYKVNTSLKLLHKLEGVTLAKAVKLLIKHKNLRNDDGHSFLQSIQSKHKANPAI